METGLNHLHSFLRYLILAGLLASVVLAFLGWQNKKPLSKTNDKLYLITFVLTHIQLLIGLIQYVFTSSVAKDALSKMPGAMGNSYLRYWAVEHITAMIIAIALITIGRIRMKKQATNENKHKTIFIFYSIGLLIIVLTLVNGNILFRF